ncbi:MAG TPA: DUF551 domain-containing protein [Porticoccaceae bacterium]
MSDDIKLPPLPEPPKEQGHRTFAYHQMQAFARAAIEADRKARGEPAPVAWIPVSERLPEDGVPVLLWVQYGDAPVVASRNEGKWFAEIEYLEVSCGAFCYGGSVSVRFDDWEPTHWQPLPEPPKAGRGE